jgi:hypothetical protein
LRELELRKRRGELLESSGAEPAMIALCQTVAQRFEFMGSRIAHELAGAGTAQGCQLVVDRTVRSILSDLAAEGAAVVAQLTQAEAGADA